MDFFFFIMIYLYELSGHMDMSFWIFNEFMNMFMKILLIIFFFSSIVGLLYDKDYISLPS
jgi:hypothetical protein